ncbi:MAG: NAD(P)H-hydrate epimerase, partial [Comamonadaceae bacterium]
MQRITSRTCQALHDIAGTRRIEQALAATLPAHTLMQRAGLAVARLAMAVAPHARVIWIACGPGNNGGDGFEAAAQLQQRGFSPVLTFTGDEARLPEDARASLQRARKSGITLSATAPDEFDLAIDAMLGIGAKRAPQGVMAQWLQRMHASRATVLSIDIPSGLDADTGVIGRAADTPAAYGAPTPSRYCLSLLTLKPGLFTAQGRDAAGEVWFDDLGAGAMDEPPVARIGGSARLPSRAHASHKGSFGDVMVVGGAHGMAGAANDHDIAKAALVG